MHCEVILGAVGGRAADLNALEFLPSEHQGLRILLLLPSHSFQVLSFSWNPDKPFCPVPTLSFSCCKFANQTNLNREPQSHPPTFLFSNNGFGFAENLTPETRPPYYPEIQQIPNL